MPVAGSIRKLAVSWFAPAMVPGMMLLQVRYCKVRQDFLYLQSLSVLIQIQVKSQLKSKIENSR